MKKRGKMFDISDYENAKGCLKEIKEKTFGDLSFPIELSGDYLYEISKLLKKIVSDFEKENV